MFKSQTVRKSTGMIILLLFLANAASAQELTEGNAASWGSFAADGAVTRVLDDAERVKVGTRSIKFVTKSAVNTGIRFPSAANAHWNLTDKDHLTFWAYAINKNVYGFEGNQPNIVLKTSTGNFRYESQGMQMVHDTWVKYYMPLEGDARWIRTEFGSPTLADVNQLEIHQDTWDSGFTVYYDGVEFERLSPPPLPRSEPSLDVPKQTDEIKQHAAPDYSRY